MPEVAREGGAVRVANNFSTGRSGRFVPFAGFQFVINTLFDTEPLGSVLIYRNELLILRVEFVDNPTPWQKSIIPPMVRERSIRYKI